MMTNSKPLLKVFKYGIFTLTVREII